MADIFYLAKRTEIMKNVRPKVTLGEVSIWDIINAINKKMASLVFLTFKILIC